MPRSLSTAFEKMMAHSNRFHVVSELFIDTYKNSRVSEPAFARSGLEFVETYEAPIAQSKSHKVFVKDMAYHALPFITDEMVAAVNHTFLTRDPVYSIPSLFRMRADFSDD